MPFGLRSYKDWSNLPNTLNSLEWSSSLIPIPESSTDNFTLNFFYSLLTIGFIGSSSFIILATILINPLEVNFKELDKRFMMT
jgi:hypothetical protein